MRIGLITDIDPCSQNSGGCKKLHLMAGYLDTSVFGMKGMANLQLAASNAKTPMWHL